MGFCQTHLHTHIGSQLDAIAGPEEYAEKAYSLGHPALAITEHGKMSSTYEHFLACKKYGLKPIFGVESYVTDELEVYDAKGKRQRTKNYHINLFAKNKVGFSNLLKLNYISMSDDSHFYYTNRLTLDEIIQFKEGLMITTGCGNSPINVRIANDEIEEAKQIFDKLYNEFQDNMFGEVQLNEFTYSNSESGFQEKINEKIIEWSREKGIPIILAGDVHYLNPNEGQIQTLSIAIRNKQTINNLNFEIESKHLYYHDIKDYIDFNTKFGYNYKEKEIIEWCENTMLLANKVENDILEERKRMYIPTITEDDDKNLVKYSMDLLPKKFDLEDFKDLPEEYKKRLKTELEVIIRKGFSSYMLLWKEIFDFVDEKGYYKGVGRGSACGSLVAYALGITTIDPIKFDLLFERFLSQERTKDVVYNYFNE